MDAFRTTNKQTDIWEGDWLSRVAGEVRHGSASENVVKNSEPGSYQGP